MILVALGSNLGDRQASLSSACAALEATGIRVLARSSVIEVPALLPADAPEDWNMPFLNQVISVATDHGPAALMDILKSIEKTLGRQARGHWAPREIDLDLIAYADAVMTTPALTLPHPRLHERAFVLRPLMEIAPEWRHPLLKKTAVEILAILHRPELVAILNLTPDSFSGDGAVTQKGALERFTAAVEAGADVVDIGAESTRPGATLLTPAEEWQRLEPVLAEVIRHALRRRVRLSVDTRHAATAEKALAMGVDIINDVSGLVDPTMVALLKRHTCPVIVMHALTLPADPNVTLPATADPVAVILAWKHKIEAMGIARERLIFDPGIGFGKTAQQSWDLIERAHELVTSGGVWLYGHSRKSFMKIFTDAPPEERDRMTLKFSLALACAGVQYLRVHHIPLHRESFGRAA